MPKAKLRACYLWKIHLSILQFAPKVSNIHLWYICICTYIQGCPVSVAVGGGQNEIDQLLTELTNFWPTQLVNEKGLTNYILRSTWLNLTKYGQIWPNLVNSDQIWSILIKIWSILSKFSEIIEKIWPTNQVLLTNSASFSKLLGGGPHTPPHGGIPDY